MLDARNRPFPVGRSCRPASAQIRHAQVFRHVCGPSGQTGRALYYSLSISVLRVTPVIVAEAKWIEARGNSHAGVLRRAM